MLPQMYKYLEKSGYRTRIVVAAVPKRIMDMNMLTRFIAVRTGGDRHFSFALERSKKMVEYYASYVDSLQKLGFELQIVNPADGRNLGGNRASAGFAPADRFRNSRTPPSARAFAAPGRKNCRPCRTPTASQCA